jgi:hypothetical protein
LIIWIANDKYSFGKHPQKELMNSLTYCRFVSTAFDCKSYSLRGFFSVAAEVIDTNLVPKYLIDSIRVELAWFNENMEEPECYKITNRDNISKAVCWFKSTSHRHIKHAWNLKVLLSEANVLMDFITTKDPGAVIWQDDYQVVALPWKRHKDGVVRT